MSAPSPDTAVVWVALGTPTAPTPSAVRRYLREFLTDPRIVDMNPVVWRVILELFVLPVRARASAAKYESIWDERGSPLLLHTIAQATALQARLDEHGCSVEVAWAMRYGEPSVSSVLEGLRRRGVRRVLVAPAYPQYSQTTVGSVYDAVADHIRASRDQLELRFLRSFPRHPLYIEALAASIERSWEVNGRPDFDNGDVLLLSFHGIPVSMSEKGDPYARECEKTTVALRERLGVDESACRMVFQSKFGPAAWLTPATIDTVAELGRRGVTRVDVACPAFTADCLETLEEIDILNREAYHRAVGQATTGQATGGQGTPGQATIGGVTIGGVTPGQVTVGQGSGSSSPSDIPGVNDQHGANQAAPSSGGPSGWDGASTRSGPSPHRIGAGEGEGILADETSSANAHFYRVPCLNADPLFIDAVADIVRAGLAGW